MNEEEINDWYEEEKERIMEVYLEELKAKKDHDQAEKRFNIYMEKAVKKYNDLMEKNLKKKSMKINIKKNFDIKNKLNFFKKK